MSRTTRKQLEGTLTRLCEAAGIQRAASPGDVGVFLEPVPGGYAIRKKNPDTSESDIFGAGIASASETWERMSFALQVLGASSLKEDADAAREARETLYPDGDLGHEFDMDDLEAVAEILDPSPE